MSLVADGKVVIIHYTLKGEDGDVIESTHGREPMAYLHGRRNVIPGMEAALAGRSAGDQISVTIPPAEAYGERAGPGPQEVPRKEFPRKTELRPGTPLQIRDSAGSPIQVWVTRVQGSKVWIDIDHPLAGRTLQFDVEIVAVRAPYAEELEHGHAHGAQGGHHH